METKVFFILSALKTQQDILLVQMKEGVSGSFELSTVTASMA